jgi:uncharacterized protein
VTGVTLADTSQDALPNSALQNNQAFRRGIEQFNSGHFFEAHETWEEIWLQSPEPDKTFLQGIIQITAAFHHHSRGNLRGARSLLEAGLARLDRFPDAHRGIALVALRAGARAWVASLADADTAGTEIPIPRIESARND